MNDASPPPLVFRLQEPGALSPALWYADPLAPDQADTLLRQARDCLRQTSRVHAQGFPCRLQELIARYWLGRDVEGDLRTLQADGDGTQPGLVSLLYGQLLAARKRRGALEHLATGFTAAAPRLRPAEYFRVLKRHALLSHLPYGDGSAEPQDLQTLLAEAAVIRRLQGRGGRRPPLGRSPDTVG